MRDYDAPSGCLCTGGLFRIRRSPTRMFKASPKYKEMDPYMRDADIWREDVFDYQLSIVPRMQ